VIHERSESIIEHNQPEPSQRSARSLLKKEFSDPRYATLPTGLPADFEPNLDRGGQ
jgi:hypothetical protein